MKKILILLTAVLTLVTVSCKSSSERENTLKTLQEVVENEAAKAPYKVDEITTLQNVEENGSALIYSYTIDEDQVDFSVLNEARDDLRSEIISSFKRDPNLRQLAKMLNTLNYNLIYRYTGDQTGETTEVVISPSEI